MSREELLKQLDRPASDPWDLVVIGGGAVGIGTALDAVSRGYSCVLFEQHDFCKGTSSRSTKLIHGGVRYLAQGNVSLVREALHERGLLLQNAPTMVRPLRFIVPCYSSLERWYYWAGMKCYDALAGNLGIESSRQLKTAQVAESIPGLRQDGVRGGVAYFDAQFDDARLVISVARKVRELGGVPLNYMRVSGLLKNADRIAGVTVQDVETSQEYQIHAKAVVNAAGTFSDDVRKMEMSTAPEMISPSQGIHLVVHQKFLGGRDAIMIPKTKDGRVLFAIPWLGRVVLGTTDTPVTHASLEPRPQEQEIEYLIQHFAEYLDPAPRRDDVLSLFAGLRPLVKPKHEAGSTAKISREHRIIQSQGGLISILGGKWTTFRKMAEDVVDVVADVGGLPQRPTATLQLQLEAGVGSDPSSPEAAPTREQVVRCVRHEFARTVEDVLARRFRSLLLDARRSVTFADDVAAVLTEELGHDSRWCEQQIGEFSDLARQYTV